MQNASQSAKSFANRRFMKVAYFNVGKYRSLLAFWVAKTSLFFALKKFKNAQLQNFTACVKMNGNDVIITLFMNLAI